VFLGWWWGDNGVILECAERGAARAFKGFQGFERFRGFPCWDAEG